MKYGVVMLEKKLSSSQKGMVGSVQGPEYLLVAEKRRENRILQQFPSIILLYFSS